MNPLPVAAHTAQRLEFAFHGVRAAVTSDDAECLRRVEADFALFLDPGAPAGELPDGAVGAAGLMPTIEVRLTVSAPPYERIPPDARRLLRTKDATVYRAGHVRFYDSGRLALVAYDMRAGHADVWSLDRDLLQEKCYLLVMTRVGDALDRRGLHRIHAMGMVYQGRALLCVLPSGGGKTTLAMALLEREGFRLLSEEVPLVCRRGRLHPFPVRLSVVQGTPLTVPDRFLQPFRRSRHGPKVLIDSRHYADRIAGDAAPGIICIGRRVGAGEAGLVKRSRFAGLAALLGSCVAGRGVPQLLEYLLHLDLGDVMRHAPVLWSRLRAAAALARRSTAYELRLGPDSEGNASLIATLLTGSAVRSSP
ncbi:MAG TPA: hypothetical protein VFW66_07665 [Gemmatimonadales bacterium]|nr:hypothetical protein [Gemmatimonadales bacterium]